MVPMLVVVVHWYLSAVTSRQMAQIDLQVPRLQYIKTISEINIYLLYKLQTNR